MTIELDIARVKEKAILLIPAEKEEKFRDEFDCEICYDLIENIEDYIAEGVASYYLNK